MSNGIRHGKGNSLSPEPCALIPTPVGHSFMSLQGGRESTIRGHVTAAAYPGMNAIYTC